MKMHDGELLREFGNEPQDGDVVYQCSLHDLIVKGIASSSLVRATKDSLEVERESLRASLDPSTWGPSPWGG